VSLSTTEPLPGRGSRTRVQRLIVVAACLGLLLAMSAVRDSVEPATAQSFANSQAYLPFQCGGSGIARRQTMGLYDSGRNRAGNDTAAPGQMFPCLSGTEWHLSFGNLSDNQNRGSVHSVNISDFHSNNWTMAGGNTVTNIYQLSFDSFVIGSSVNNVSLTTVRNTPVSGESPYVLGFAPQGGITIGGSGVMTDMLVDGNSQLDAQGTSVFGLKIWVTIKISTYTSISWLLTSNDFPLSGVDLYFYYLTTHVSDPGSSLATGDVCKTNPYCPQNAPSGTAVQLPNTQITVS
jgi:hypothetical protein